LLRSHDHGSTEPGAFLFFWENTDGQDVLFHDGKVKSGRRGDLHIIGELYIWHPPLFTPGASNCNFSPFAEKPGDVMNRSTQRAREPKNTLLPPIVRGLFRVLGILNICWAFFVLYWVSSNLSDSFCGHYSVYGCFIRGRPTPPGVFVGILSVIAFLLSFALPFGAALMKLEDKLAKRRSALPRGEPTTRER
jgi:hypothetical protein